MSIYAHSQRIVHLDKETVYFSNITLTNGQLLEPQDTITVYKQFNDYWSAYYKGNIVYNVLPIVRTKMLGF